MSLWNPAHRLVLASGSATRQALLASAGLSFEIVHPQVDERAIEAGAPVATPQRLALSLARAKALDVSARTPEAWVIGADQVLSLEGGLIHKSHDRAAAMATLGALSGRTHRLTSAFALARGGEIVAGDFECADLTMRLLDEAALRRYLDAAGEGVLASVGVYQWEGLGAHLFARVEGDHSTILGLPMLKLLAALRSVGAVTL